MGGVEERERGQIEGSDRGGGRMGKERRGMGRRGKRRGGEREGLPPLEWRSGYAPDKKTDQQQFTMYSIYTTPY